MKKVSVFAATHRQLADYGMKLNKRRKWFVDELPPEEPPAATPPAGALSTENMIPQSRFNQVNDRMKAAEDEMGKMRQAMQLQKDTELTEQKRYQELAESRGKELEAANLKAARIDELEAALLQTLDAQVEGLPEKMRKLVPSHGTPQERLAWINENAADLTTPKAPGLDGGAGKGASGGTSPALTNTELTIAKAAGMTAEEYSKIKNDRETGSAEQNETLSALDEAGLLTG